MQQCGGLACWASAAEPGSPHGRGRTAPTGSLTAKLEPPTPEDAAGPSRTVKRRADEPPSQRVQQRAWAADDDKIEGADPRRPAASAAHCEALQRQLAERDVQLADRDKLRQSTGRSPYIHQLCSGYTRSASTETHHCIAYCADPRSLSANLASRHCSNYPAIRPACHLAL